MLLSQEQLRNVESGDLNELAALDARGLFPAPNEDARQFARRLKAISDWKERLSAPVLRKQQKSDSAPIEEYEGFKLSRDALIPGQFFLPASKITQSIYQFAIDWMPGFYVNPTGSWLFGGCTFCESGKPLFIIRKSFKTSARWLIYHRDELISHELCHVARMPLDSVSFEENFAYQTSSSAFRRISGGIFYRQWDAFLFLFGAIAILFGQILRLFHPSIPLWPFAAILPAVLLWLCIRLALLKHTLNKARANIEPIFKENAQAVLFRATDQEIKDLTTSKNATSWLASQTSLRWAIIKYRFLNCQLTMDN